jgi:hypothetical protein
MAIHKRSTYLNTPPLSPTAVCLLLGGYSCDPAEGGPGGFGDAGDLYFGGDPAFAEAWTQHEAFLRAEAKRRGIEPEYASPRGPMFFGERLAAYPDRLARYAFDAHDEPEDTES